MAKDLINITADNINEFYKKVNKLIDKYFEWNIKPSALKNYMRPGSYGLKKFVEWNELSNIKGIERVIRDVVDDRHSMELDNVMTFENYGQWDEAIKEMPKVMDNGGHSDILFKGLKIPDDKYERVIADYFKTSPSHIEPKNKPHHQYQVTGLKLHSDIVILSKEDLKSIKSNLFEYLGDYLMNQYIEIPTLGIKKKVSELSEKNDWEIKMSEEELVNVISEIMKNDDYHLVSDDYKGYLIWEK